MYYNSYFILMSLLHMRVCLCICYPNYSIIQILVP